MRRLTPYQGADLFAGYGGMTQGAQGFVNVLFAANHWEDAVKYHALNHPNTAHACQDLMQFDMCQLPHIDFLLAAPACQGLSQASQPARAGTGGNFRPSARGMALKHQADRNTAWAVVQAMDSKRPQVALIENVPELLKWQLFPAWLNCIRAMGYHVEQHQLRGVDYGSAQDRTRAIMTASLHGPVRLEPRWTSDLGLAGKLGDCLDLSDDGAETGGHRWSTIDSKSDRMRWRMRKAQDEAGALCVWNNVSESRGRSMDDYYPTLTTKCGSQLYLLDGERCRILNPRELARGQSFPDTYVLAKQRELSGKLVGNAIDVRLARGCVEQLCNHLDPRRN